MTYAEVDFNAWIRRYHPSDASAGRLVCFPHAGGSASYYHPLSERFSPAIDVIALQYPGRQDPRQEACIRNIQILADKITEQLLRLSDKPTLFFGHSMGATLAFEVAWRLEERGHNAPLRVIVSGRSAPGIVRSEKVHQRDDAGILAEIRHLNGTESALLEDEEILRMSLPSIRGDDQAIETYSYTSGRILSCPITMFTGDSDPHTTIEQADAWRYYTEGSFRIRVFPGGHFYLSFNTASVAAEIARDLEYVIKRASLRESSPVILSLCAVSACNPAVPSASMPSAAASAPPELRAVTGVSARTTGAAGNRRRHAHPRQPKGSNHPADQGRTNHDSQRRLRNP
jgi:surfactin synthase thioesterase subunit